MSFNPASPVVGAAVTGLTSPTYTITADTPPAGVTGKQWAVTALGGTQTGVDSHTVSKPFTITFTRPPSLKTLPAFNGSTGTLKNVPVNAYKVLTRKGAMPAVNQSSQVARVYTVVEVPAGTDSYEPEEIKAMVSAHIGALWANASGIADTVLSGVI